MKCLIVDDEPLSLDILEKYIADVPGLELAGRCLDAFDAMDKINTYQIDLVFLDINMPRLSGLNMVKSMTSHPEIVFTTAYPEHAVEGFELDVLDYLVKPISFARFVKAIEKAKKKLSAVKVKESSAAFMMVKSNKKLYKVPYSDISYIQSMGDFVKIHTTEKVYITSDTLKNIETQLPQKYFLRTHKSYIIALEAVKYLEGNQVILGSETLPIGLTFKETLLKALDIRNES